MCNLHRPFKVNFLKKYITEISSKDLAGQIKEVRHKPAETLVPKA